MSSSGQRRGRARDPDIDARVLAVASRHLSTLGYEAMSLAAVAQEAGTTRQAVYRRWPTKASLASAAVLAAADAGTAADSTDPFADLVSELADFQRGVSIPGRLSLVGTMLQDSTAPELRARYRARVIAPRRGRIRAILERARQLGLIDADADLEVAVTLCTGSWYARALAGQEPPENWPARTAALVWRAVGGTLPRRDRVLRVLREGRRCVVWNSAGYKARLDGRRHPAAGVM
jgi:AcrR family transcriptional regulator